MKTPALSELCSFSIKHSFLAHTASEMQVYGKMLSTNAQGAMVKSVLSKSTYNQCYQ